MLFGNTPGTSSAMYRTPYWDPEYAPYGQNITPDLITELTGGTGDIADFFSPTHGFFSEAYKGIAVGRTAVQGWFNIRNMMSTLFDPGNRYARYRAFRFGGPVVGDIISPFLTYFDDLGKTGGKTIGAAKAFSRVVDLGPTGFFNDNGTPRTGYEIMKMEGSLSAREAVVLQSYRYENMKRVFGISEGGLSNAIGNNLRALHRAEYGKHPLRSTRRWRERFMSAPGTRYMARKTGSVKSYLADQKAFSRSILGMEVDAAQFFKPDHDPLTLKRSGSLGRASFYNRTKAATLSALIDRGKILRHEKTFFTGAEGAGGEWINEWDKYIQNDRSVKIDSLRRNLLREAGADGIRPNRGTQRAAINELEAMMSPAERTAYKRFLLGTTVRHGMLNMLRVPAALATGATFVAPMAIYGIKRAGETLERAAETIRSATRMDFGGDDVIASSRLASERQRQMAAINDSGLNARGLLGNEAQYYH